MSLLNKFILTIIITGSISLIGLSTDETPLFDPLISGSSISLGKAAAFSSIKSTNMIQNPATIAGTKSVALSAIQYFGIDYSSLYFTNQLYDLNIGFSYTGSSISGIERSSVEGDLVKPVASSIPYEFHSLTFALSKSFNFFELGVAGQLQTLVLDDVLEQKINQYIGIIIPIGEKFMIGGSVQNISSGKVTNALQKKYPINAIGISYNISKKTNANLSLIHNKNEVKTHSTLHYGVEHYISDYIPLRAGLDHNRYTFGTGLNFDPFEIDIGWAQSRHIAAEDQVTMTFTYNFEQRNHLY